MLHLALTVKGALERRSSSAAVKYRHCVIAWPQIHWSESPVSGLMQRPFILIPFATCNCISTVHIRSCLLSPGPACQYVPCMPWSRNLATQQFCYPRLINPLNLGIHQNLFKNSVPAHRKTPVLKYKAQSINPLNSELNPICYLLALLGAHHFLHVSRIRVKSLTLRQLMSYIYIWSTYSWCF